MEKIHTNRRTRGKWQKDPIQGVTGIHGRFRVLGATPPFKESKSRPDFMFGTTAESGIGFVGRVQQGARLRGP